MNCTQKDCPQYMDGHCAWGYLGIQKQGTEECELEERRLWVLEKMEIEEMGEGK